MEYFQNISTPNEQRGQVHVSVARRVVQRDQAALVLGVDVGALLQQELRHLQVVVARGQVQRGGVAALGGGKERRRLVMLMRSDHETLKHLLPFSEYRQWAQIRALSQLRICRPPPLPFDQPFMDDGERVI